MTFDPLPLAYAPKVGFSVTVATTDHDFFNGGQIEITFLQSDRSTVTLLCRVSGNQASWYGILGIGRNRELGIGSATELARFQWTPRWFFPDEGTARSIYSCEYQGRSRSAAFTIPMYQRCTVM